MKKFLKYFLWAISGLLVVVLIVALFNYERIVRLYNVNSLFSEEKIVSNFSSMDKMFLVKDLPRSGDAYQWKTQITELPSAFTFVGSQISTEEYLAQTSTTSLLVLSDGNIVFEDYYLGTKIDDKRISWSMAKSFLSALFGVAVFEGKIASLEDAVTKYVPELEQSAYNGVKIIDVLHMASGVEFDEDYLDYESDINRMGRVLALGGSMDEFAASISTRARTAGIARQYVSIDTHVLSMVLRAATGKSLAEYFEEKLWAKLGAGGNAYYVTDGHGVAFALGGLNMRTRDYALFGQLFLQNGKWGKEQIIPKEWAKISVLPSAPRSIHKDDKFGYGYQWWVPVNSDEEFYAIGIYGQYLYINRKLGVVIVKTSADRDFKNDGEGGNLIEQKTIEMFRAIAQEVAKD